MTLSGRSVIFGMKPEEAWEELRGQNETLFKEAETWRASLLTNDNLEAKHFLIAGISGPTVGPDDITRLSDGAASGR